MFLFRLHADNLSRNYESMLWAVILFMFSGLMGLQVFSTPLSPGLGLMTLFTGFFGLSTILYSLGSKPSIRNREN